MYKIHQTNTRNIPERLTKTNTTPTSLPNTLYSQNLKELSGIHNMRNGTDDDEALLEEDSEEDSDSWDNGILRLNAGLGKENKSKLKRSKMTLSDEIRTGKYGLIEKELFNGESKRPGVISYLEDKETPLVKNRSFGGLNEDDIWLAEDHLLVVKGGNFNKDHEAGSWPSIDDYEAPSKPIKIPFNPEVPPPFPVQFEENEPIKYLQNINSTLLNNIMPIDSYYGKENKSSVKIGSDNSSNLFMWNATPKDTNSNNPGSKYADSYPKWFIPNQTFFNTYDRPEMALQGLGPFPIRHKTNFSNVVGRKLIDEEETAQYYPPAYSFVFENNSTNIVPPGPLVPGIVVAPPPNQFSRLEKGKNVTSTPEVNMQSRHPTSLKNIVGIPTVITYTNNRKKSKIVAGSEPPRNGYISKPQFSSKSKLFNPISPTKISKWPLASIPSRFVENDDLVETFAPVPVPVAVPIPVYIDGTTLLKSVSKEPFTRTTVMPNTGSQFNAMYNENLDANQVQGVALLGTFLSSRRNKISATTPKIIKSNNSNISSSKGTAKFHAIQPTRMISFKKENLIYITPKPPQLSKDEQSPHHNTKSDIEFIRNTLLFYKNSQHHENSIPRNQNVDNIYVTEMDVPRNIKSPINLSINFQSSHQYAHMRSDETDLKTSTYDKTDKTPSQKPRESELFRLKNLPEYVQSRSISKHFHLHGRFQDYDHTEGYNDDFKNSQTNIVTMHGRRGKQRRQQTHKQENHLDKKTKNCDPFFLNYPTQVLAPFPSDLKFNNASPKLVRIPPHLQVFYLAVPLPVMPLYRDNFSIDKIGHARNDFNKLRLQYSTMEQSSSGLQKPNSIQSTPEYQFSTGSPTQKKMFGENY